MEINIINFFKLFRINILYVIIIFILIQFSVWSITDLLKIKIKPEIYDVLVFISLIIIYYSIGNLYVFLINYYEICNITYNEVLPILTIVLVSLMFFYIIIRKIIKLITGKKKPHYIIIWIINFVISTLVTLYSLKNITNC